MKKLITIIVISVLCGWNINANAQWYAQWPAGIYTLATKDSNIYAGGDGVLRSTNNGNTWTQLNTGIMSGIDLPVYCIAFSGNSIFIGTGDYNGNTTTGGVYLSSDNGNSWSVVKNGMDSNVVVQSLVVNGNNIFAGTTANGIFLSTNNGQLWTAVNNGLDSSVEIVGLAMSGNNIFAATNTTHLSNTNSLNVFLSTNNGQLWTAVDSGLTGSYITSVVTSGTNIFAVTDNGVFLSANNGTTWKAVNNGLSNFTSCVLAVNGTSIYLGDYYGIYLFSDSAVTWTNIAGGLTNGINSFAFSGNNIFAGGDGGVSVSYNNGYSWAPLDHGCTCAEVQSFDADGNNIFVPDNTASFYRSTDNGQLWTAANSAVLDRSVICFANMGSNIIAGTDSGMFRSADTGKTWTVADNGLPNVKNLEVMSFATSGSNIFAGTDGDGVYISTDTAKTWTPTGKGLPDAQIRCLAMSGNNIFAGTSYFGAPYQSGIFLSFDNGLSWTAMNNGLDTTSDIMSIVISGTNIFAATQDYGLFRSNDNGYSWTPIDKGLTNIYVWNLITDGNKIFAATEGGGVFLSTDNGDSWSPVNEGITSLYVYSLAIIDSNIFAGTNGGINIRPLSDFNDVAVNNITEPESTVQLYPNPTTGKITIQSSTFKATDIYIYNMLGEKIFQSTIQPSNLTIDLSSYPSGIYLIHLRSGDEVINKKLVLE